MPLILPLTRSPSAPPINTTSNEDFISFYEELERQNYLNHENKTLVQEDNPVTDKMTSKKTRAAISKKNELESVVTPLVKILENIKKAKVM